MLSYKKIFIFSLVSFVLTVIFGFIAYQSIFEFIIKDQISLHRNNYARRFYLKYPIPLDFRVYFFNVSNPEEVHKGAKPILTEIGPYCYDLYKERINVTDDETDDSLTYTPHDTYLFNQERSGDLKEDDYVTIIHPLIMGMVNYVAATRPQLMQILDEALPYLFDDESIYLTAKVKDILFDGMDIDCSSRDFSPMAVCSQLKNNIPGIKKAEDGFLKYGVLTSKNGTIPTRVKVLRGVKESNDLGRLVAVDNVTKTTIWATEECNTFHGTDGWIFPPFSNKKDQIWFHPIDFCMNLHADFVGKETSHGLGVRKYYATFEDECSNCTQSSCAGKGLIDLSKCIKVPLYISLPHLLKTDEELLEKVDGLEPNVTKHVTRVLLEETLSLPMEAHIRVQFNFPLKSISKISFMGNVPEAVHPVLWIEMGVVLNGWFLNMILAFFYFLTFFEVLKYVFLVLSLLGMGYAGYLYLNNKKLYSMKETIVLGDK